MREPDIERQCGPCGTARKSYFGGISTTSGEGASSCTLKAASWRTSVETTKEPYTKAQELRSFLFLSVVMAPVLAGIIVAGWGFVVWMYQILAGPPGS